jgi:amidohydrolase
MVSKDDIRPYENYLLEVRRYIHRHPETGFEVEKTAAFVCGELKKMGFEVFDHVGKTSVVGLLKCPEGNDVIGLRADMDALMINEENDIDYKSEHLGMMHACGHDAHTAMLLTACKFLSEHKQYLKRSVKVIFQAAEEGPYPGGAKPVVESGILDDVSEFYALHVTNALKAGKIGIKVGVAFACADEINIEIYGKGSHAAEPHKGIDPIVMQAEVIMLLQTLLTRTLDPVNNAVLTIGEVHAGSAFNIIPEKAVLKGTLRTLEKADRDLLISKMDSVLKNVTGIYGGSYRLEIGCGYPVVFNSLDCFVKMRGIAVTCLGSDSFVEMVKPYMMGEDFAFYANHKKGCLAWLGTGNKEKGFIYNNHHPKFNIDEDALKNGVLVLVNLACND